MQLSGILVSILLSIFALVLPVNPSPPIRLGLGLPPLSINENSFFLGARFTIDNQNRPILFLLFLALSIWFVASISISENRLFIPIGLGMAGFLVGGLTIYPPQYANLFIGFAVLLSIPIISPPGQPHSRGNLQYLTNQILGLGLILLANLTLLDLVTHDEIHINSSVPILFLFLGYALVLPIFPFHSWVPLLTGETKPIKPQFVFFFISSVNVLLFSRELSSLKILYPEINFSQLAGSFAILMVFVSGLLAAFEDNLLRVSGFVILQQIGNAILGISLMSNNISEAAAIGMIYVQFIPFNIALVIFAVAIFIIQNNHKQLLLLNTKGISRKFPIATMGLLITIFSISGYPALPGFPIQQTIWSSQNDISNELLILSFLGRLFLIIPGLRFLSSAMNAVPGTPWKIGESRFQIILICSSITALFLMGLFSNFFISILVNSFLDV